MPKYENPKCPKCGKEMVWTEYLLARRPDALRGKDERAPIDWAYHCRCGMWVYGERRRRVTPRGARRPGTKGRSC